MAVPGKLGMLWLDAQEWGLARLDAMAARRGPGMARHLEVGLKGERAALFELRRRGYTVVAQRWTSAKSRGDVDLIAWSGGQRGDGGRGGSGDSPRLCFIEVKTRTQRDRTPAESAVDEDKRQMVRGLARAYLATFPEAQRRGIAVRFDVVSVYWMEEGAEFEVFEGAFGWR